MALQVRCSERPSRSGRSSSLSSLFSDHQGGSDGRVLKPFGCERALLIDKWKCRGYPSEKGAYSNLVADARDWCHCPINQCTSEAAAKVSGNYSFAGVLWRF